MYKIKSIVVALIFAAWGCSSVSNPFDDIERPEEEVETSTPLDSTSIVGLHKLIFEQKCAIPSCHGGTFEPDFRTPASSYNTLVYRPVIKNDEDYTFRYRVVPGDTTTSWLHERLLTDDPILGRMPRYQDPLSDAEMRLINRWILDGAKDMNGIPAQKPNTNVQMYGLGIYDLAGNRYDNNRPAWHLPSTVPANKPLRIFLNMWDEETPMNDCTQVRVSFSKDGINFDNPIHINANFNTNEWQWYVDVNTNIFQSGDLIYVRLRGTDADHTTPVSFPTAQSYDWFWGHYSFQVQ